MSSKWLILLTLISFLQLAVTLSFRPPPPTIDTDDNDVTFNKVKPDSNFGVTSVNDDGLFNSVPNVGRGSVNRHHNVRPDRHGRIDDVDSADVDRDVQPAASIEMGAYNIDTSYYYRLTNAHSGRRLALDVVNDRRDYALKMAGVGSYTGQFWYFVHLGNNVYNLRTRFLGNRYSLDIVNDGINDQPHMSRTGDFSGQRWHLILLGDGTFRLRNEFTGNRIYLDVHRDTHDPRMHNNNVDYTGQHWTITKIERMTSF
jgi:hypothetical protein